MIGRVVAAVRAFVVGLVGALAPYRKAIVSAAASGLVAYLSGAEPRDVALAALGALGVTYAVPNAGRRRAPRP